jgi:hypothetical protein
MDPETRAFLSLGGLGAPDDGFVPEDERAPGYFVGAGGMHALARGLVKNRALTKLRRAPCLRGAPGVRVCVCVCVRVALCVRVFAGSGTRAGVSGLLMSFCEFS